MIGLIVGETDLPKIILKKIKKKKIKYLIVDLSAKRNFKKDKNSFKASIGQFGKIINILKNNNCKKVLFAGKVKRPNFSKLRLDLKGIYYIPRIIKKSKLGDAAILKEIINILSKEKIKTISSIAFNNELALKSGIYTKTHPNNRDNIDITIAKKVLKKTGDYNYSQGAIIREKKLIAIEGKDGTHQMLLKCKRKKKGKNGVLVKFPKPKQDIRIDLPTIGLETIKQCRKVGLKGLVLKAKQNIFLDKQKSISYANKNNMFIKVER